jgi:Tfp pilus assembly major pilin PilA
MGRTGHDGDHGDHGDHEPGKDRGENGKRIDLSLSQVAGAGAATLTAATAASYLNVYGTVIGAAVIAVLSTIASPLLQHWFDRSGARARQLAVKRARARQPEGEDAAATGATRSGATPSGGSRARTGRRDTAHLDATRTMALPTVADGRGPEGADTRRTADDGTGAPARPRLTWRTVAVPAAVVFVLVMLVILCFELLTGRSLTAWTNGVDESTSPSILGGGAQVAQEQDDTGTTGTDDTPEQDTGLTRLPEDPPPATEAPEDTAEPGDAPADGGTGQDGGRERPDQGTTDPPEDDGTPDDGQGTDPGAGTGEDQGPVTVPEAPADQ